MTEPGKELAVIPGELQPRTRIRKAAGTNQFNQVEERQLLRDIVNMRVKDVAAKWNVTPQYVSEFRSRHTREVEAMIAEADNDYAGQWAAKKELRIQALMELYEETTGKGAETVKAKTAILKEISEQLGQTPVKSTITMTGNPDVKVIVGVDINDL